MTLNKAFIGFGIFFALNGLLLVEAGYLLEEDQFLRGI